MARGDVFRNYKTPMRKVRQDETTQQVQHLVDHTLIRCMGLKNEKQRQLEFVEGTLFPDEVKQMAKQRLGIQPTFDDAFEAAFGQPEPKSDLAIISEVILGKPTNVNHECLNCKKWTGVGQYYERTSNGIRMIYCRNCGMGSHPDVFDPPEVRERKFLANREKNDRDTLIELTNRHGPQWVIDTLIGSGHFNQ